MAKKLPLQNVAIDTSRLLGKIKLVIKSWHRERAAATAAVRAAAVVIAAATAAASALRAAKVNSSAVVSLRLGARSRKTFY